MTRKTVKARIDEDKHGAGTRILNRLNISIQDAIEGWWLRLVQGDDAAEAAAAEYHRAKADVAALERREERLEERIEQLREEREEVRAELADAREMADEAEEDVVEAAVVARGGGDGSDVDSGAIAPGDAEAAAYAVLRDVAHDELGTNGITSGNSGLRDIAKRAEVAPADVVEEMRELAVPVDAEMQYESDVIRRSFLITQQDKRERVSQQTFNQVRRAVASEVLEEEDVDWDRVPEDPAAAYRG